MSCVDRAFGEGIVPQAEARNLSRTRSFAARVPGPFPRHHRPADVEDPDRSRQGIQKWAEQRKAR
jgi:hypothetical protein